MTASQIRRLVAAACLVVTLASPAMAQKRPGAAAAPAAPETQTVPAADALGRTTPRGTVLGFLDAARGGDHEIARHYLNTPLGGDAAEELARQLYVVLDTRLPARLTQLSDSPEGSRANPLVWGLAFIFLATTFDWVTGWNVFTGHMPVQQSVQASPRPGTHAQAPIATASLGGVGVEQSQPKPQQLPYFFVGSTKADVYRLHGMPNWANDSEWHYGSSRVYFSGPMVARWESKPDMPLNAITLPPVDGQSVVKIGSTPAEVLAIQGAPTSLKDNYWAYPHDQVVKTTYWQYGNSQIEFSEGRVIGWTEAPGKALKVKR